MLGIGLPAPVAEAVAHALLTRPEGGRLASGGAVQCLTTEFSPDELAQVNLVLWDRWQGLPQALEFAAEHPEVGVVVVGEYPDPLWMAQAVAHGAIDAVTHAELVQAAPALIEKFAALAQQRAALRRSLTESRTTASQLKARNDRLESEMTRLEAMAWTDPLTGLANRRQLDQRLPQLFAEAVRYDKDLACLMIDLDHFKEVNDNLGHAKGDEVLLLVARLISSGVRTSDIAARYGGDEFVVIMPQTSARTAARVARRIVEGLERSLESIGAAVTAGPRCGMSVGVSCLKTSQPIDGEDMISQADSALLAAKTAGKGKIMLWAPDGRHAEAASDITSGG